VVVSLLSSYDILWISNVFKGYAEIVDVVQVDGKLVRMKNK